MKKALETLCKMTASGFEPHLPTLDYFARILLTTVESTMRWFFVFFSSSSAVFFSSSTIFFFFFDLVFLLTLLSLAFSLF